MKNSKNKKSLKIFIIIILFIIISTILLVFILNKTNLFKINTVQNNTVDKFKLPFEEKEYADLIGYNFFTKNDGTILIKPIKGTEIFNIPVEGTTINVKEKVVKIESYTGPGNGVTPIVVLLTESGTLYNLDLGQDILNDSNLYKYSFNQNIKDIRLENIQSIKHTIATAVELENGEVRLVGPKNILLTLIDCSMGKKALALTLNGDYIVIDNDDKIRIGDINKDKYYSISEEKWINENADIANYNYLKDETGKIIKAKDFQGLYKEDVKNIYIITDENKLIYLSVSDKSLLKDEKILEKYEIKLNKQVTEFATKQPNITVTIKFIDGTCADIKDNNIIFGMLSNNNNFFTFAKQELKDIIEYKILTDKSGVNYKIKDYQIIDKAIQNENIYIINIFMITENKKMIMTRLSNNQNENYIDQMKIEEINSDKLIDRFDREYTKQDGYTTKIVFKDGTKVDFNTFVKEYLQLG